jgi:tRNA 5-methylaminomethyl-2-thiouridine biosynthesis bifunctional protein
VFLDHNRLTERFAALDDQTFIIVETGFGTGLNCLEAIALFQEIAPPTARLQLISCDMHPLLKQDLTKASEQWPHLAKGYSELIDQYPPLVRGTHCIRWSDARIQLLLWWTELDTMLANLSAPIDAWFLDGFAPSRNPLMWSETLYRHMNRLGKPQATTFATFTAASAVRRGLAAVDFAVTRGKGYGHKRHMLHGVFGNPATEAGLEPEQTERSCVPTTASLADRPSAKERGDPTATPKTPHALAPEPIPAITPALTPPWFHYQPTSAKRPPSETRVAVVGAGISGLTTAYLLAEAGFIVSLYDEACAPVQGGSGNPQAVLYTRLSCIDQAPNRFHNSAFQCAINQLERLQSQIGLQGFTPSGSLEKLNDDAIAQWQQDLETCFHDTDWITICAKPERDHPLLPTGDLLSFPRAGWFSPSTLASALLSARPITCHWSHQITLCEKTQCEETQESSWALHWAKPNDKNTGSTPTPLKSGVDHYDHVILCAPNSINQLLPGFISQLRPLPGQINQVPASSLSQTLNTVLTGPCSLLPALDGQHTIGSTYRPGSTEVSVSPADTEQNLTQLAGLSPVLQEHFSTHRPEACPGRAATRWNTRDYLPLVGPVPDLTFYENNYRSPQQFQRRTWPKLPRATYQPNLWINTGHGSRGFTQSWLCAEIILAYLSGIQLPIDQNIGMALHPARYYIRALRKR